MFEGWMSVLDRQLFVLPNRAYSDLDGEVHDMEAGAAMVVLGSCMRAEAEEFPPNENERYSKRTLSAIQGNILEEAEVLLADEDKILVCPDLDEELETLVSDTSDLTDANSTSCCDPCQLPDFTNLAIEVCELIVFWPSKEKPTKFDNTLEKILVTIVRVEGEVLGQTIFSSI